MEQRPEIVRIKLEDNQRRPQSAPTKALQIKLDANKTAVVYNHIQGYILDALMKAVFANAH